MPKLNNNLERGKALRDTLIEMLQAADPLTPDHALAVLAPVAHSEEDTAMLLACATPKGKPLDSLLVAHFASSLYLQKLLDRKTAFKSSAAREHTTWAPGFRKAICSKLPEFERRFNRTHQVLEDHDVSTAQCQCAKLLADMETLNTAYAQSAAD